MGRWTIHIAAASAMSGGPDKVRVYTEGSLVVPPDSEIVALVLIWSPAAIRLGRCSLIEGRD